MQKFWLVIIPLLLFQNQCDMKNQSQKSKLEKKYYRFIKSCIHPATSLARRWEGERFTTPYANALAAMALIHEHDLGAAEKIFDPFQRYYQSNQDHFNGLPQIWNVETGLPDLSSVHWEGDAAFLTLALNYYKNTRQNDWQLQPLLDGLIQWLLKRTECSNVIVAEGIADLAAALAALGEDRSIQE